MLVRSPYTLFLLGRYVGGYIINRNLVSICKSLCFALISAHELQGSTAVALYGLGNIRDERLNRMFQVLFVQCCFLLCCILRELTYKLGFFIKLSDTACCTMDET